jgi:hypothetical protein
MHLDAPSAKWTFDYCIEQSGSWPIHLSQVRPWPETWANDDPDWEATVRNDPDNQFSPIELQEGEAIIFSGSSQWHYRDRIYTPRPQQLLPPDILPLCSRRNATLDGTQMLGGLFRYSATD